MSNRIHPAVYNAVLNDLPDDIFAIKYESILNHFGPL